MHMSISKRVVAVALALGVAGGALGASVGSALAATRAKPVRHTAAGVVASVEAKAHQLTVKVGKKSDVFRTTAKTAVEVAGKKDAVAALKAGEHVKVTYVVSGKAWVATAVAVPKA